MSWDHIDEPNLPKPGCTSSAIIIDSATEIMNTGQFVEEEEIEEIVEESQ